MKVTWTPSRKAAPISNVTGHHHAWAALPPGTVPSTIYLSYGRLALAIGRAKALSTIPGPLLKVLASSSIEYVATFLDPAAAELRVIGEANDLADVGLSQLAHDLGAGVASVAMDAMGFAWQANAKEWLDATFKRPDSIWLGTDGAVSLCEAKGSASATGSFTALNSRTDQGFREQVAPWLGRPTISGTIASGFAIGTHAPAGGNSGLSIHVPEPALTALDEDDLFDPGDIVSASLEADLRLMGAWELASAMRLSRGNLGERVGGRALTYRVVEAMGDAFVLPPPRRRTRIADPRTGENLAVGLWLPAFENAVRIAANDDVSVRADREAPAFRLGHPAEEDRPILRDGLALVSEPKERRDSRELRVIAGTRWGVPWAKIL